MIVLDPRVGSGHLLASLESAGLQVERRKLDFADIAFAGNGPEGPIHIGVEVKAVGDLVSSLVDKRFTGRQLPGMIRCYERVYLAVVGRTQPGDTGGILTDRHRKWFEIPSSLSWEQLEGMKMSLREHQNVRIVEFDDDKTLVAWIVAVHKWWSRPWEDHKSHIAASVRMEYAPASDRISWMPPEPTNASMVAGNIPGIGLEFAKRIGDYFDNPLEMASAKREIWNNIKGLGERRAARAFLWLRSKR